MSIEVMRQVRNALVWNLNTDLDNIPACEQWAKMLRKNIDALDKAIEEAEHKWVGLTDDDEIPWDGVDAKSFAKAIEAKLKEKNT